MNNLEIIRAIFSSLSASEKVYKFSELRNRLAKENVDVSGFNLRRKADQQALLSAAEKCIYDLERENRIQTEIQEFVHASAYEDVINNESDYPDIPLTYGWQFEGVDNSEDCFLYPATPLTCDVLSGQCCELLKRSPLHAGILQPSLLTVSLNVEIPVAEAWQFEGTDLDGMKHWENVPVYPQCPLTCDFYDTPWYPESCGMSDADWLRNAAKESDLPFFKALERLLGDNPDLLTTKGLEELLNDCSCIATEVDKGLTYPSLCEPWVTNGLAEIDKRFLDRYFACPGEFETGDSMPDKVKQGFEFYGRISKLLDSNNAANVAFYHAIRANIHQLQESLLISGLKANDFNCRGVDYLCLDPCSQLDLTNTDLNLLKSFAPSVARHFCYLARLQDPRYKLSRVLLDEQGHEVDEIATTFRQIKDMAQHAQHAILRHESHAWEFVGNNTWQTLGSEPNGNLEPDLIELTLIESWHCPKTGEYGQVEIFRLTHPDPVRQPWKLQNSSLLNKQHERD